MQEIEFQNLHVYVFHIFNCIFNCPKKVGHLVEPWCKSRVLYLEFETLIYLSAITIW